MNDISKYAEELAIIFSDDNFKRTIELAEELEEYATNACEIDALESELKEKPEIDKDYYEREHTKEIMNNVHGLFELIDDFDSALQEDLEELSDAEQFIGGMLLTKPIQALYRCAEMLYEL